MLELGQDWLISQGLGSTLATIIVRTAIGLAVMIVAWISGIVARRILLKVISRLVASSKNRWDDIILEHGVLDYLIRLVPAMVLQMLINIPLVGYDSAVGIARTAIDIYIFLKEQRWVEFEAIQSDIFDHMVAVIPEFGLRIFQQPTGQDVVALAPALQNPGA